MNKSFPAYYEERVVVENLAHPCLQALKKRALDLNWREVEGKEDSFLFKVRLSFYSWGEKVRVRIDRDAIVIRSECLFPLQCFDWGKNRENVRSLASADLPCA